MASVVLLTLVDHITTVTMLLVYSTNYPFGIVKVNSWVICNWYFVSIVHPRWLPIMKQIV